MGLNYWGVFFWFALTPDSSLLHWEKALLSLDGSSTDMHRTAVDFAALFTLLKQNKRNLLMDHDLFSPVHSFLHQNVEPHILSDSASSHLVQKRFPFSVPSDMVSATLQFLRRMAQEVQVVSLCCWTKGFQTTKAEKWGAPSSLFFGPVSHHTAPGICLRCLR